MLPTVPGHNATVLVALAVIGGTPSHMSAGNVSRVPPPAIELTAPPAAAAATMRARWEADAIGGSGKEDGRRQTVDGRW
jgi:hypothetical protein